MRPFNPYKREHNLHWAVLQLRTLLSNAIEQKSSTYISYAALEGRMIIERVEFDILVMAAHESVNTDWQDLIEKQNGIQKVNSKYKALRFKYQTFTEAFSKVIFDDLPVKPFEFRKAEDFQSKLSQYIHIYTRTSEEIKFESEYMQNGIKLIEETISFLENMFTIRDKSYIFGVLNFASLKNGFEVEFKNWLNTLDEDVEGLIQRLRIITNT
jgi:hypothetical protein